MTEQGHILNLHAAHAHVRKPRSQPWLSWSRILRPRLRRQIKRRTATFQGATVGGGGRRARVPLMEEVMLLSLKARRLEDHGGLCSFEPTLAVLWSDHFLNPTWQWKQDNSRKSELARLLAAWRQAQTQRHSACSRAASACRHQERQEHLILGLRSVPGFEVHVVGLGPTCRLRIFRPFHKRKAC